jgi:hypothetical protein
MGERMRKVAYVEGVLCPLHHLQGLDGCNLQGAGGRATRAAAPSCGRMGGGPRSPH